MSEKPDTVLLYEGKHVQFVRTGHWEYATRPKTTGIVYIIALTAQNEVLLTEQYRIPVGKRVIELPAGLAGDVPGEEQEPLVTAARRELLEETLLGLQTALVLLTLFSFSAIDATRYLKPSTT